MIKRILVPIDGSASADTALSIAGSLSALMKAELVGLFVEDVQRICKISLSLDSVPESERTACEKSIADESIRLYENFQNRCRSASIIGRFLSLRGTPEEIICQKAKTVDFVVIGNSGLHSGVEFKEAGQTLNALLKSVARPVLVVPEEVSGESIMAIAYDGTLAADRTLKAAAELAEVADIEVVHLITVTGSPDCNVVGDCHSVQGPAIDYLSAYDFRVVPTCLTGNTAESIEKYVEQIDASFLALGAFGAHSKHSTDFGQTTEALLKSADAALLLVA